jgi:hypothetical protein
MTPLLDPVLWAKHEFGRCGLGHKARSNRLVRCASQLYANAAASIPVGARSWGEAKALYRFCDNRAVTHDEILHGHLQATVDRASGVRCVLVASDTTHFSFGGRQDAEDLGPVDTTGKTRGFMCHTALAFDAETGRPLGVLAQKVWARQHTPHPRKEDGRGRRSRLRESQKWIEVAEAADRQLSRLGASKPQIIDVFDAEGDHFETIERLQELGHDFVIRACRDRLLDTEDSDAPEDIDDQEDVLGPERKYLSEAALTAPVVGTFTAQIPPRAKRAAREARFEVRVTTVLLRPPLSRDRQGASLQVSLVYASELETPHDADRICLLLLTRQQAANVREAEQVVQQYLARWLIEEFHKAIKTGCSFEKRELQTFARLTNLLAITCPIAIQMLALRHVVRQKPHVPATTVLTSVQIKALRSLRPKLGPDPTAYVALREIAGAGGFLGRKHDGEPGWLTLWRGFRDLLLAERIYTAATETPHSE